jgi:hypothetical protein
MLLFLPMAKPEVYHNKISGGKTFTMGTSVNTLDNETNRGIVPRVIQ